jgi:hypothetical protein
MALSEAIIATYMTIHMARSPVHTVGELRLLARSSGRERKSCGCGFQATKGRVRFVRGAYPPCQNLGVRSALLGQRYARLELKGQIGVVVVGWDWGTGEWAKSSTLLSCGAAFGTVL